MPSLRAHRYLDLLFFKKSYYKIHRAMDHPVRYLGKSHRILFHDPVTATLIAQHNYPNDPNATWVAQLHIQIDQQCSANPAFKKFLEASAKDASKRRKRKRKAKKSPDLIPLIDPRLVTIAELWAQLKDL